MLCAGTPGMSDPAPLIHTPERTKAEPSPRRQSDRAAGDLHPLLALQHTAGNQAVAELVASSSIDAMPFLQRAPVAAPAYHAVHEATPPPQPGEPLYHLTIGTDDRANITKAEALKMLHRHLTRVQGWIENQKDGLTDLRKIHDDQWIVAGISDYLGGGGALGKLHIPELSIFDPAFFAIQHAQGLLDAGELEKAADKIMEADFKRQDAQDKVIEYREGSIHGAERSVTALKVAVAAGAIAATVATGGTAAAAGAGVLGTAGAVAVGAGVYGEFSEMGTQSGEMIAGQRQAGMFDPVAILKRAGTDAAVAFVTAYLGGSLSKVLVRSFGQYLISSMGEEAAATLAQEIGVAGKLTPELVVSNGQKFIIEFFANTALTPLTTAIQAAVDTLKGGKFPGRKEFTQMVVQNMIQGGILQLFLAGITHGAKAAGMETGMEPAATTKTPAATEPPAPVISEPAVPVEPTAAAVEPPTAAAVEPPTAAAGEPVAGPKTAEAIPEPTTVAGKMAAAKAELPGAIDEFLAGLDTAPPEGGFKPAGDKIIFETDAPKFRPPQPEAAPGGTAPSAEASTPLTPDLIEKDMGMPVSNQEKFQAIVDKEGIVVDVRPTTKEAPKLLQGDQPALPKPEDIKAKTINNLDTILGADKGDVGKVGYFKPNPPERPSGMSDADWSALKPKLVDRFIQREAEYWDQGVKMTKLQSPVPDQPPLAEGGTHGEHQVTVGPDGKVLDVSQKSGKEVLSPFTGDHDIYDIRRADGTPLSKADYDRIIQDMKDAGMGVKHGAHMKWEPQTGVDKAIHQVIVNKVNSGQEPLLRFEPGQAPAAVTKQSG